jgi:hypothetical protein
MSLADLDVTQPVREPHPKDKRLFDRIDAVLADYEDSLTPHRDGRDRLPRAHSQARIAPGSLWIREAERVGVAS